MAIYRNIQMTFWTDTKVVDDFTPEDKYFYLYILTNAHTNLCGCYEISVKQIADETGYSRDTVEKLIKRFSEVHEVIRYSASTKELLLLNWSKYNWTESEKFRKSLLKEIEGVKCPNFRDFLLNLFNGEDTVSIPYAYGMDTTVTVTDTDTVSNTVSDIDDKKDAAKENTKKENEVVANVVNYLNNKAGTSYRASTRNTRVCILARLREKYTEDDFYTVINKKVEEWKNTDMERYIRPETLFGSKFEGYLNQKVKKKTDSKAASAGNRFFNFQSRDLDVEDIERQLISN